MKIHEAKCINMVKTIGPLLIKGERNRINIVEVNFTLNCQRPEMHGVF